MHRLTILCVLGLAGCPPPPRYAVIDVIDPAPVEDALVSADCGRFRGAAMRTDDRGRATVQLRGEEAIDQCVLTVAKPGYPTVEVEGVQVCTYATACPPTIVQMLAAVGVELPQPPPEYRSYAQPPRRFR